MNRLKKILIVEDELVIAENTKYFIEELIEGVHVEIAGSSYEARTIMIDFTPDLVFLDIHLGKNDNGIEFASSLAEKAIPFIFLTAYGDEKTISAAITQEPIGYLVKPISKQDLFVNLKLALNKISTIRYYIFKDGTHDVRIPEQSIVYLQVDGNYTEIHTTEKRYVERKSLTKIIEELEVELIRIHRNCYVNPYYVKEANASAYLTTGEVLPISRNYKKDLLDRIFKK
ncbi:MAG: response regulator transcription factor [Brumimicrobium sp.]|nr:response regulator transcription factor [Brumimicrobium sp.]